MVPKAVLMKSSLVSVNIARQVNTSHRKAIVNNARPMTNLSKLAHSTDKNVNTAKPKAIVNVAKIKAVVNALKGNNVNAVKASACWVWKPKAKVLDHTIKRLIEDMLPLEVTPKEGKSKERYNQNCHVLLKVPRKNNMYIVDLKNIVPKGGLTCLFAKASSDESELWHKRLGHINFKTMNKLVKGNLVRGLPLELFEIHQTCVACQKGKQHRASSTKDETSGILKSFITKVENLIDQRVKVLRCDNGTKFKNKEMNQFYKRKGIKSDFSVARTPQQNGVAKRKNRTLIKAARTLLADFKIPTTFWALGFMRPFGCPVTIFNTIDHLGKFDGKADEGFFVGYSINSKAFRLVVAGNQYNGNASTKACDDAGKARMKIVHGKDYILLPLWTVDPPFSQSSKSSPDARYSKARSTNNVNVASTNKVNAVGENTSIELPDDPNMHELEDIVYSDDNEDVSAEADMNNLDAFMHVSPIPTTRVHKDHPVEQIIGDLNSAPQTRRMTKNLEEHVARIEAIRLFLAYASFKDFVVYQMDVKSAFLYGKIEEEVYVCQPPGFEDPDFPDIVYKVEKALYGLHQDPRACSTKKLLCTKFEKMMLKKIQMSSMGELTFFLGLQVKQKEDEIFINQDKYLKGQPKLGLWYPKDSPFDLVAYTDSDYAGASLDRKSTTGGCQFLGSRLISWQCKKQTVVANSITEAEYVAASSCYGQVLWIQNQLLDYG
ncbi:putative ribonuclease H-like domain-containing protein, partial [Tanacetum coccineum]